MIVEYLVIPEKIKTETYELNHDEYKLEYFVKKDKNFIYLFPKDLFIENKLLINAYDLAEAIKRYFNSTIFIIVEEKDNNMNFFIGNTEILEKDYFAKFTFPIESLNLEIKKIKNFLDMLKMVLPNTKTIIFNINVKDEIVKLIPHDVAISSEETQNFFKKVPVFESKLKKKLPLIIGVILILLAFYFSTQIAESTNFQKESKIKQEAYKFNLQIRKTSNKSKKLKKELIQMKNALNGNLEIYKGQQ
ncbi:hypothetical protein [Caminibacter pacificus]|uniref:Uncharacterized protein n=1 Tax=Caminibacter pacificus TaxID=1424653 RepID=A0AAJ4UX59_9BACT|nr:hypothetical protein [Caminibacter pacificus]QDD68138.1 hypothetical protein C6V80_09805 [Caminibacter pacificus]ROR38756.1 hypothetical protein EDC58_1971 [Caminibacter pacificus]